MIDAKELEEIITFVNDHGGIENIKKAFSVSETLGADGLPVKVDEDVYLAPEYQKMAGCWGEGDDPDFALSGISKGERLHVSRIRDSWAHFSQLSAWCPIKWLTHTEPDTLEKIKEDAKKYASGYWGCIGVGCNSCPAKVDGLTPVERFGVDDCHEAKCLDIVRRMEAIFDSEGSAND